MSSLVVANLENLPSNSTQRAHPFVTGNHGNIWQRVSSGVDWSWQNLDKPPTANLNAPVGAVPVTDPPASAQRPHAFVDGSDGHLWVDFRD
jgi:hypothetical protein